MIKPIKRITVSDKDRSCLLEAEGNRSCQDSPQPEHYRDRVVLKPWGYEFLIFENPFVAIWFLFIKKDRSTSMHCHPIKKTSLTLLSGKALCNTFRHRNFLSAGDSLIIDPAVFHSTKSISPEGITLVEVETPPAKLDLCRFQDRYGRQTSGYESQAETVTDNLEDFGHFYFDNTHKSRQQHVVDGRFALSLERYSGDNLTLRPDPGSLYCVCQGRCVGANKKTIVHVGETERGGFLREVPELSVDQDTVLLKMNVFD